MIRNKWARRRYGRGFSLVELMLATTLFMLLSAGSLNLLAHVRQLQNVIETKADLEERAAFVMALLEEDIRLAGFWGLNTDGSKIHIPETISIRCSHLDITNWALQTDKKLEIIHNNYTLPCPPFSSAAYSDTLVIRHASPKPVEPRYGTVQIESTPTSGEIFNSGFPTGIGTFTRIHNLELHGWYIDETSSEPGLSGLRRYTLSHNGRLLNQEIMPGVEHMQIRLGIDTNGDKKTDAFVTQNLTEHHPVLTLQIKLKIATQRLAGVANEQLEVERIVSLKNRPAA